MPTPHTQYEQQLRAQGYALIAGVDEVGRGAWAGPIVAAAVILPESPRLRGVRDSKQLTPARREVLAERIRECAVAVGVGVVSQQEIDRSGISYANQLAMQKAVIQLGQVDYVLLDGRPIYSFDVTHTAIVKGDALVYSIAAASIVAKVARDHMMREYHAQFPKYQFHVNKGYGTPEHQSALQQHGVCALHRLSFQPMHDMVLWR